MKKGKRILVLSGGAFRGAVQVPVIKELNKRHKYDEIYGVSVGSLNGALFAQNDLDALEEIWLSIDGLGKILKPKWWWPFQGFYSMKPLRKLLENLISVDKIKIPFRCGVTSLTDGKYYEIASENMKTNEDLWNGVESSSSITGIMINPNFYIDGVEHVGADGGFRNIIPVPKNLDDIRHIDIVVCTPKERINIKQHFSLGIDKLARSIEIMEDEIFQRDLEQIATIADQQNTNDCTVIRLFAPLKDPLGSFNAKKKTIKYRFELGKEAFLNPTIYYIK